jgi:zinc transporter, ZIP family
MQKRIADQPKFKKIQPSPNKNKKVRVENKQSTKKKRNKSVGRKRPKGGQTKISMDGEAVETSVATKKIVETKTGAKSSSIFDYSNVGLITVFAVSCITLGFVYTDEEVSPYLYVWAYSWMTAVCTGIGALPFLLVDDVSEFWLGICNASAAGMMIAASVILFYEGLLNENGADEEIYMFLRLVFGMAVGMAFIRFSRHHLEKYEDLKMGDIRGMDAKKVLLLMGVMTIHSLSEGVGIGVAFSGSGGSRLGALVSSSLAIHNIPEGLAVALVLVPKGFPAKGAIVWSIFSSIPQPIMAVPTFAFVAQFIHVLPYGLGFAAGAMVDVSVTELLPEAMEMTKSTNATLFATGLAGGFMLIFQLLLEN